ncbi:hypothetical protein V2G26_004158 [Clonostachys chloroleuca]|uniref:Zn(2)-C6 fungal-type domain-containing protein n=1 Tax=Clonostachys chloroleuca TaxID=1926264 RepID=A0AA35QCC1_9HYPO|nr:unnamed protein product [Clonostachys chloroleuca]
MSSEEPVRALRDIFGDPKPPEITRKITACVACRKQKIKCQMGGSRPPCVRCKRRGLSCVVNQSLQMLLESDVRWRDLAERKFKSLEQAVQQLADKSLSVEDARALKMSMQDEESRDTEVLINTPRPEKPPKSGQATSEPSAITVNPAADDCEVVMDLASGASSIPGFHISPTPGNQTANANGDIISNGIITAANAERYFKTYQSRLDHFPYRILGNHSSATLDTIRKVTPLLTAAVCTVGALHIASGDFEVCYREFISLSASRSFSKSCTVDDVRALCIGAFWLSGHSWTLVASAVRIATELHLHRSIFKALQGDRMHYYRTRLYLLVYACDHHFSVAFGRPPMTRECETIRNVRKFLDCPHATPDDARLVSQVLRWSLCSQIYDSFGTEVEKPLSSSQIKELQKYSIALDSLRMEWADSFSPNIHIGDYPRKGVTLQYHFAKLYLCSHAFRCTESAGGFIEPLSELDEVANLAIVSALAILKAVVHDAEIQSFLDGLPIYFDTMIAFAVVFLVKVFSNNYFVSVRPDKTEVYKLLESLLATLKRVTSTMHPQHLLVKICKGIETLLQRSYSGSALGLGVPPGGSPVPGDSSNGYTQNPDWDTNTDLDLFSMSEYDFLNQDIVADFPFTVDAESDL